MGSLCCLGMGLFTNHVLRPQMAKIWVPISWDLFVVWGWGCLQTMYFGLRWQRSGSLYHGISLLSGDRVVYKPRAAHKKRAVQWPRMAKIWVPISWDLFVVWGWARLQTMYFGLRWQRSGSLYHGIFLLSGDWVVYKPCTWPQMA